MAYNKQKSLSKQSLDWSDKKVLIVDDAGDVLTFVSILLHKTKIQIVTARNGQEAIEKFKEAKGDFDLILMDIQMPGLSGIETMEKIRSINPDITVFAQTAFALEGDEERFLDKGFDAYVSKPVNKNELLAKMAAYMKS